MLTNRQGQRNKGSRMFWRRDLLGQVGEEEGPRHAQEKLPIKKQIDKQTQTQISTALQKFRWMDRNQSELTKKRAQKRPLGWGSGHSHHVCLPASKTWVLGLEKSPGQKYRVWTRWLPGTQGRSKRKGPKGTKTGP